MNATTEKVFVFMLKHWADTYKEWGELWCARILNAALKEAGVEGTSSAMARSFLDFGGHISEPQIGDIVVLWREAKESPFGHCGLYVYEDADSYFLLGGNQDNRVKIKPYPKTQLLGVRRIQENENTPNKTSVARRRGGRTA